jgi:hypothetical protein
MADWKSIETAPKDGTIIRLNGPHWSRNPPMDDEVKAVLASGNALKDIMRWHRVQQRLFRQRMADYMQKIAEPADSKGV